MRPFDIKASRFGALLASAGAIAWLLPAAGQLLDDARGPRRSRRSPSKSRKTSPTLSRTPSKSRSSPASRSKSRRAYRAPSSRSSNPRSSTTVQQQVESGVVSTIAEQLESSVAGEIGEQLLDAVEGEIDDIAEDLGDTVGGGAAELGESACVPATPTGRSNPPRISAASGSSADVDALGRSLERDVWIILVPTEHAERIRHLGLHDPRTPGSRDARPRAAARRGARGSRDRAGGARARARRARHRGRLQSRLSTRRGRRRGRHGDRQAGRRPTPSRCRRRRRRSRSESSIPRSPSTTKRCAKPTSCNATSCRSRPSGRRRMARPWRRSSWATQRSCTRSCAAAASTRLRCSSRTRKATTRRRPRASPWPANGSPRKACASST